MRSGLLTAVLFCFLAVWGELNAQMRYPVIASNNDMIIIENPPDRTLEVGEQFYVLRRKGLQELALAIAEVDKFKGNYCRLRMTERIIQVQPGEGDYLIDYDPTRYTPWGDGFDLDSETPAEPAAPPAFSTGDSSAKTELMFTIFSGFGLSNFDTAELYGSRVPQSGYLPLGAQFLAGLNIFQIGAEFNYAAVPFTFENKASSSQALWKGRLNQVQFGALVRVNLVNGFFKPFLRAGSGVYTGNAKREYSAASSDETIELDTNFGFNFGAGVAIPKGFLEFVYHLVDRSRDVKTVDPNGKQITEKEWIRAYHWAFRAGVQIPLN
jgi:hypothetical protein